MYFESCYELDMATIFLLSEDTLRAMKHERQYVAKIGTMS